MDVSPGTQRVGLRERLAATLNEHPDWLRNLAEMVSWETAHPIDPDDQYPQYRGWESAEVHTANHIVTALVARGLVDQRLKTNRTRTYRLSDLGATIGALSSVPAETDEEETHADFENLFSLIIGQERPKRLIMDALSSRKPVHMALLGPPGVSKSMFLEDLELLPDASRWNASSASRAGIIGLLVSVKPRYLILDEVDKMRAEDVSPLYGLMEGGFVTDLKFGKRVRVSLRTWVFAAANDEAKIPVALRDRFRMVHIRPYTREEFVKVCVGMLAVDPGGIDPETAALIAERLLTHGTTSAREARDVARMAQGRAARPADVPREAVRIIADLHG